jgi:hypothetical protein
MSTTHLRTPEEKGLWRRIRQYLVKKAPTLRKLGRKTLCHTFGLLVGVLLVRLGAPHRVAEITGLLAAIAAEEILEHRIAER